MPQTNNNMMNMIGQFQEFRRNFKGDPKQEVMKLLQSGRMSQQQLNQLQSMASYMQSFLK